ncbi:hypothetical protein FHS18_004645 [Paenibacillus phyllosphaerae]|uniref:DUF402 domain-containing protein n=1 Tax=Paenibacillus phyllosphaerae TaxID=274593 RepID=A0A7W5FQ09_9BACL|nr:DUF402 domain-containing protein [Paenibacillus phyllosphaerae]MBB3112544.1 hypothetical protein [Paenibacillus phyllosphaerae]
MSQSAFPKITIQALKYGDRLHYEWETQLLERTDTHVFVLAERGRKLHHYTKQKVFTIDRWTIEFFSSAYWFTVSADVRDGNIVHYYCNINEPAIIAENAVSFVDLDLDLLGEDGQWRVVDEDEFERHSIAFGYPEALIARARSELAGLQLRIAQRRFPFDGTLERLAAQVPRH